MAVLPTAPPGLTAVQIDDSFRQDALTEVHTHKLFERYCQAHLQWSFRAHQHEGYFRIDKELASFPCIARLVEEGVRVLPYSRPMKPGNLNVIVRLYRIGEGIGWHTDGRGTYWNGDYDLFEEPVYGCVLHTQASSGLQFRKNSRDRRPYAVPEHPGIAFLMTGRARYEFQHGIENIDGVRISVTWRWVKDSFLPRDTLIPPAPLAPDVKVAAATSSTLSQDEKSFLKCCKLVREIWKLEERKRHGEKINANEEQKCQKKMAALKDATDQLGNLADDSSLRQRNEDVIMAAEVAPKAQETAAKHVAADAEFAHDAAVVEPQVAAYKKDSPSKIEGASRVGRFKKLGFLNAAVFTKSEALPDCLDFLDDQTDVPASEAESCHSSLGASMADFDCSMQFNLAVVDAQITPNARWRRHDPKKTQTVVDAQITAKKEWTRPSLSADESIADDALRKRRGQRGGRSHDARKRLAPKASPAPAPAPVLVSKASPVYAAQVDAVSSAEVSTKAHEPTLKDMVATIREQLEIEDSFTTPAQIIAEANRQLAMPATGTIVQQARSLLNQLH